MLFLIQKIQDRITDKGGKIFLNSTITSITHNSPKKITFEQNNQKNYYTLTFFPVESNLGL